MTFADNAFLFLFSRVPSLVTLLKVLLTFLPQAIFTFQVLSLLQNLVFLVFSVTELNALKIVIESTTTKNQKLFKSC